MTGCVPKSRFYNWVYSIYAIITFAFLRYAITIRIFGNMPLQFDVCLRCVILYIFDVFGPICRLWYVWMDKNAPATSLVSTSLPCGAHVPSPSSFYFPPILSSFFCSSTPWRASPMAARRAAVAPRWAPPREAMATADRPTRDLGQLRWRWQ
jgi:hypothetical protein